MTDLALRSADSDDRAFLVEVMRTAATSHLSHCVWDVLLGLPAADVDRMLGEVSDSAQPHWCHLSRFWIAERGGEPIAALSSFDAATEGNEALERALLTLVPGLGFSDGALQSMLDRAAAMARGTPPNLDGTWGVENVAVRAPHRGGGAVDALLEHALDAARQRGYRRAQVLCLNGNVRAERTWQRHGFVLASDYRDQDFERTFGSPGLRLHVRDL